MEQMLSGSLQPVRYLLLIVGGLAGLAVVITAVGLYALLAFSVREQEKELALRLALGASRSELLRVHVGHGLLIAVAGTIVGTLGALAASPLMERVLPAGENADPLLVLVVALLAIVSASLSSLIGARRVLHLRPSRALRDI
jgi:putative ABC transport system permease protein